MAELAELPSPHDAPTELQSRAKQRPQEGVLTPRELAAAFSLQYDPMMDAPGSRSRRSGGKGLLTAALLLLVVGGGASTFYFSPTLRERFVAWVQDSTPAAAPAPAPAPAPAAKPQSDGNPAWMMSVPNDVPPIGTQPKQNPTPAPANPNSPNPNSANPTATNSNTFASNNINSQPTPPPAPVIQHTNPTPAPVTHDVPPPANASTPIVTSTPTPDPRITDAATTTAKLRRTDGSDLDQLAMDLRSNGLDAEHRQDLYSAQYFYQQVESLPRDHWPNDIDLLLKNVQKQLAATNTP
jgi:hypothetical protein